MKRDRGTAANHLWPIDQKTERGKIARRAGRTKKFGGPETNTICAS
jgi:hypothetical protein